MYAYILHVCLLPVEGMELELQMVVNYNMYSVNEKSSQCSYILTNTFFLFLFFSFFLSFFLNTGPIFKKHSLHICLFICLVHICGVCRSQNNSQFFVFLSCHIVAFGFITGVFRLCACDSTSWATCQPNFYKVNTFYFFLCVTVFILIFIPHSFFIFITYKMVVLFL